MKIFAAILALLVTALLTFFAQAATFSATAVQTPWGLYAGAGTGSRLSSHASFDDCVKAAAAIAVKAGKATCKPPVSNVTVTAVIPPATATWTFLGYEETSQTVPASSTVRYGYGTAWAEKQLSGTFACDNDTFGDPLVGQRKQCELKTSGGTTTPPPVTGTATVSWAAPTTNADGTPLADLAGYRVLYGTQAGTYTQSVAASVSPVTVQGLAAGTWFFVVQAIDTSGNASTASAEVSKTIQ